MQKDVHEAHWVQVFLAQEPELDNFIMAGAKLESQTGSRGYLLLYGACCQKAVHIDPLLLPIAPHSRSGLLVIRWVPAWACRECVKLKQAPLFDITSQFHRRAGQSTGKCPQA